MLDPDHKDAKGKLTGKATWFKNHLGFTRKNAKELAMQIKFDRAQANLTQLTPYGQKYCQIIEIWGTNGQVRKLSFNWIENTDGIVRLIGTGKFPHQGVLK